ncbi:50S ribosomal protein L10 [Halodesulfovibrio spirochaetisodalis]|uniref:Large ribosomal subunit protein uL10 n=1 Tax=Halodesulfovibrio spirochaetisodalis TaxID=1560234 RepID=A0A1B7XB42_9BACT|nr:50S ribosomal protein L10 [Halodesulfovibrio spirochaetisodalis]OBQ46520.1 50S ribosomal protein L10 [Halodesulfovibrio spirochaetisodalis]
MNRSEKAAIIERLKEKAEGASIAVVTDFKGLPVEEMTVLRDDLRKADGEYHVVKNTLARIAVTGGDHEVLADTFKENSAIALGFEDPVAVAKAVVEFAKKSKHLVVKHASLEGKLLTEAQLGELAKLPGKQQLLGMALGTMNAVPTNFVGLFANILRNFLYALNAIKDQKEAA